MQKEKIIVVGSGPIGLNAALKGAKDGYDILLLEQNEVFGGQITNLYPEKEIVDLKDIKSIRAQDYIILLLDEIKKYPNIKLQNNTEVTSFVNDVDGLMIKTNTGNYKCDYLILACGLGYYLPRKLDLNREDDFQNILYSLKEPSSLKNQDVVVLGGGDSAIDWTKELSRIAHSVKIIHRRKEFRGDIAPLLNLKNVEIITPYVVRELNDYEHDYILDNILIENVESGEQKTIKLDTLLVNYGSLPPKPNTFDLDYEGFFVKAKNHFQTKHHNVFSIGDMITYEGKSRRIAPGIDEVNALFEYLKNLEVS